MKVIRSAVAIVGGGPAGLSAAIYLGRAKRDVVVIDSGKSMARWEPDVQNYLGFPDGISGEDLVKFGKRQARRFRVEFHKDNVISAGRGRDGSFLLTGRAASYRCRRLLLATGIFHLPPKIPGIRPCVGHSLFFCKDCDGYRVQNKAIAIYGWSNETVRYALAMLSYSSCVSIVTDGHNCVWDSRHGEWLREYEIPVYAREIVGVKRRGNQIQALEFARDARLLVDVLFTTRGDVFFNELARQLGAEINPEGEVVVDLDMRTTVPGLYAAGCVTPANCQMIIAAGQGATAAQAINRDLFGESLETHSLGRVRNRQLAAKRVRPTIRVELE